MLNLLILRSCYFFEDLFPIPLCPGTDSPDEPEKRYKTRVGALIPFVTQESAIGRD